MKTAMIYPYESSEKAISNYSSVLSNAIGMDTIEYEAGKPFEVFNILKRIKKYNLIHFQHEYNILGGFSLPIFLLYFYLLFSCKDVVTTMHTIISKHQKFEGNKIKTFLRKRLYKYQNKLIGMTSNKIIVHSTFFKDILIYEYGLKEMDIEVIPQAIQENIPKYDKEKLKKLLKLEGPIYLIIGSFIPDHGADIIIKQAEKIGKTILVVANSKAVNDRNYERIFNWFKYNNDIIEKDNSRKYIKIHTGDISYKWWWKYFAIADLVLLPYKGGIGSGIFADAIATRTPMVCSNIPFFKNVKQDFIRIAKTDKDFSIEIKKAMENKEKMIKSFDSYIKEYGVSNISKKYKKVYEGI